MPSSSSPTNDPASALPLSGAFSSRAVSFFFPLAFIAGETPIRFQPRMVSIVPGLPDEETAPERVSWHQFAVKAAGLSFGAYWAFRASDSVPAERFAPIAGSVAAAAAAALPAEFVRYGLADSAAAASKGVPAPPFGNAALFLIEGKAAVGGNLIEARVVAPLSYPRTLIAAAAEGGAASALAGEELLAAFSRLESVLSGRERTPFLDAFATSYRSDPVPGARAPSGLLFVPIFEFLNSVSAEEYLRIVQGFLFRHCRKGDLVKLLFYRKTVQGPDGAPKRVVVRPHGLDFARLLAALPADLSGRVGDQIREGVSSPTTDDFLKRNEDAYAAALGEYRQGALDLSRPSAAALEYLHARYVYAEKRKRLDAMIETDFPMAALRVLPAAAARRAVDLSDYRLLAASLIGGERNAAEIFRWCSKRKAENVKEEARRVNALLSEGNIDPDELCAQRTRLAKKAADAAKSLREDRL